MSKKLAELSHKEQCAMPYVELLAVRRQAYAEHMAKVVVPPEISEWARKMEFKALNNNSYEQHCERHQMAPGTVEEKAAWCKTLGIWYQRLPLVTAFMVMRYGEEPVPHWPSEFSKADIQRAGNLDKGHEGIKAAERAGV